MQALRYYRDWIGTARDWARALEMFELAARAYGYALYDVAWAHYWGLGTPRDLAKAFEWHQGMWRRYQHADAAAALAAHFANGAGVQRNPAECLRWLRSGRSGPAGASRMRWLRKAADSGHAEAQYALGECFYYKGTGWIFARDAGMEWIRRAAAQGHADAVRHVESAKPAV